MPFVTREHSSEESGTPEGLFRSLRREKDGPQYLWAHQADLLRSYTQHVGAPDLALELPTGAGKTLVGMLVADWRRRRGERVVYVCPTVQLARQAAADARRAGIPVVDLTGRHRDWSQGDKMAYDRCDAVAVATYKAIFNSSPKLADAHLLVFDDAHAAANEVLNAWTVTIRPGEAAFARILLLCARGLSSSVVSRLRQGTDDPQDYQAAQMVDARIVRRIHDSLSPVIDAAVANTKSWHAWSMIRDHLSSCSIFVASDQIEIRPIIAPTGSFRAFADPRQRLYLSATLGDGAELERAFGRPVITRLPIPAGWDERGIGRRYFLLPELTPDGGGESGAPRVADFVQQAIALAGRSLLIAPSERKLAEAEQRLLPAGTNIMSADAIAESLVPFANASRNTVLALANRYDGIDLPDDTCRLVILDSLPIGADAQERFLAFTLGATRVVQERMRTRLVQGAGRATRNANDHAAVILLGRELVSFSGGVDAQAATHPEIRAELEFGIQNGLQQSLADLFGTLRTFLRPEPGDQTWEQQAEPEIAGLRSEAADGGRADSLALTASARAEILAVEAAWRGEWPRAVTQVEKAIDALAGGTELRPYQALWNHLGGSWASFASEADRTYEPVASAMLNAAASAARRTGWAVAGSDTNPTGPESAAPHERVDDLAARHIMHLLRAQGNRRRVTEFRTRIVEHLASSAATQFEAGLVELGQALGATSSKPGGEARADAVWRWGEEQWIAWEAKSEQLPGHPIDAGAIRQANTHLRAAAADLNLPIPPGSCTVLCTPRTTLDSSVRALADANLVITSVEVVRELADDVSEALDTVTSRVLGIPSGDDAAASALVYDELVRRGLLPSGLRARLNGTLV